MAKYEFAQLYLQNNPPEITATITIPKPGYSSPVHWATWLQLMDLERAIKHGDIQSLFSLLEHDAFTGLVSEEILTNLHDCENLRITSAQETDIGHLEVCLAWDPELDSQE